MAAEGGDDTSIPDKPTITYTGPAGHPANALTFQCSSFSDPQGAGTFTAMKWRIAAVTDTNSPSYDPSEPRKFEAQAVWESDEFTVFNNTITVPGIGLNLDDFYRVRVRMKDTSGRWSHWSDPVQFKISPSGNASSLRVTELMYHPADPPAGSSYDDNDFEFIELHNISNTSIDVTGVNFDDGILHIFSNNFTSIGPTQYVVLVQNLAAFAERYDTNDIVIGGIYSNKLSNAGERLSLVDAQGLPILQFTYDDAWYPETDGQGYSLTLVDPYLMTNTWDLKTSWRSSFEVNGTPGKPAVIPEPASGILLVSILCVINSFRPRRSCTVGESV
jgi:hypothetical protein